MTWPVHRWVNVWNLSPIGKEMLLPIRFKHARMRTHTYTHRIVFKVISKQMSFTQASLCFHTFCFQHTQVSHQFLSFIQIPPVFYTPVFGTQIPHEFVAFIHGSLIHSCQTRASTWHSSVSLCIKKSVIIWRNNQQKENNDRQLTTGTLLLLPIVFSQCFWGSIISGEIIYMFFHNVPAAGWVLPADVTCAQSNNRCRLSYFDTFQFDFTSIWRMAGVWYLVSLEIAMPKQVKQSGFNAIAPTRLWL